MAADIAIEFLRTKPQPRELWLQQCSSESGLWQEKFKGLGIHFREVLE